jgi:hypothetical protein
MFVSAEDVEVPKLKGFVFAGTPHHFYSLTARQRCDWHHTIQRPNIKDFLLGRYTGVNPD